jgi:hypothetical protein
MFELTIKDTVYKFRFGLGFVREIDKTRTEKDKNGNSQNVGLAYAVASLIDEDPLELVKILDIANKTEKPRLSRDELDRYIEDEADLEAICKDVLNFFKKGNSTKKKTAAVIELIEKEQAKQEAATE